MPAGILRLLREPGGVIEAPIHVDEKRSVCSSREVRRHLLCSACERRFDERGERWTINNCFHGEGRFPLFSKLTQLRPATLTEQGPIYAAANQPEIDTEALAYFAMSVYWRASVARWNTVNGPYTMELGKYEEDFRLFLLDRAPFPQQTALVVVVCSPSKALRLTYLPQSTRTAHIRTFDFAIPGIVFRVLVAGHLRESERQGSFMHSPERFIFHSDVFYDKLLGHITEKVKFSRAKGALASRT